MSCFSIPIVPPSRFSRSITGGVIALVGMFVSGCGEASYPTATAYPVKGSVLLASGKPLASGKVIFLPKAGTGATATADLGPDGTFALKTADDREGAPAGEYKVRILPAGSAVSVKGGHVDTKSLPFPASYMDEDGETGLTATVKAEATQLEPFRLVPVAAAKSKRETD